MRYRRQLVVVVAGCGTCTAESLPNDALSAEKMLFFPSHYAPLLQHGPPRLCDISQAAGVRVHSQTTRLRGGERR
ncbi:hypothetical protein ILYODFUR_022143 [Ilyodon furcidens]|uniref:Secreted protein n=1 Tax=Ilyodon furcidens TaxID=33524 RepID=A0ABV0VJ30_9TELE